ncbi:MAG: AAA-like domain-containing protein [Actinobacteria bacterium]|nr:AAA-like domain-containing protein [Actinomycetota bacterium]
MKTGLNPFVYNHPIDPPDLIDRDAESQMLATLAQEGNHARLTAPRRYGKTSLLRKVLADCDRLGMPTAYVDFFGIQTAADVVHRLDGGYRASFHGPFRKFAEALIRSIQPQVSFSAEGATISMGISRDDRQSLDRLQTLLDLPVKLFEKTGVRAVIAFDEFQSLLGAGPNLDGFLRSRIQAQTKEATYLFAGSHPGMMRELFSNRERPLFGQARPVVLGPLADADLYLYIAEHFELTGKDSGSALGRLLDVVVGHPQRAMLMANRVWDETEPGAVADEEVFVRALDGVIADHAEAFESEWRRLNVSDRRLVSALATGVGPFSAEAKSRFGIAPGSVEASRRRLLDDGVIADAGGGRTSYLVDPLFGIWVRSLLG